jgi:triphosphoribosyl-dephospho-CoA synthetase
MSLKPEPHTVVLVQERIQEALHSGKLSTHEKQAMKEFDRDLERYLRK